MKRKKRDIDYKEMSRMRPCAVDVAKQQIELERHCFDCGGFGHILKEPINPKYGSTPTINLAETEYDNPYNDGYFSIELNRVEDCEVCNATGLIPTADGQNILDFLKRHSVGA